MVIATHRLCVNNLPIISHTHYRGSGESGPLDRASAITITQLSLSFLPHRPVWL